MKSLKFLIMFLGVLIAQGVMAVTLPSTSYTPYYQASGEESSSIYSSGSTITGNFLRLGDDGGDYSDCTGDGNGYTADGSQTCAQCCAGLIPAGSSEDWMEQRAACVAYCEPGPALPLDAPLWFMLLIAVLSVTLRAYARRVSQAA